MRISPNFVRFRLVALACWVCGAWFVMQGSMLALQRDIPTALIVGMLLLASILLALGVAFWPLGADRQAGVVVDAKGLLLNMGHYAAFVAWGNIAQVGVSTQRRSLLALGSKQQLGIVLRDVQPYLQSYEERMPAARGLLAGALRLLVRLLQPLRRANAAPTAAQVAACRARTGYDLLVPEAFIGGRVEEFVQLIEQKRG